MASFIPYRDKSGNIISYQIQVYRGRDSEGKKLKPYTMSWSVPKKRKVSSIKRELERIASQCEADCKAGVVSTSKQSFKEYSGYIMQLKSRDCKHRTTYRYGQILERVNKEIGHMKLNAITAEL